jgi:hypothetical protein
MDWDFWRIAWPNAAVACALAIVPAWAVLSRTADTVQQPLTETADQMAIVAIATGEATDLHGGQAIASGLLGERMSTSPGPMAQIPGVTLHFEPEL